MRQRRLRTQYQISPDHYHSFGGSLHEKSEQALRIYSQNINGMTYTQNNEDYDYIHGTLDTMNVDVAGFSETNSPWTNHHLTDGFRRTANKYATISKTAFSSASTSIDPVASTVHQQAGGTATTVYGGWTTTIRKSIIKDSTGLGRWSGVILGGKQSKKLAILTGYRVCDQSRTAAGENTSYVREWEYFRDQGIESPNPRQQFLHDLQLQIHQLKDHDIVLLLDANDFLRNKPMSDFVKECHLHDLHSQAPARTTCHKSNHGRIDYIFGSTAVATSVIQSGILSYAEGLTSDHRGLFVDLDYKELLQLDTANQIMPLAGRILKSGNPEMTDKYNTSVTEYFDHHNMFERLEKIAAQAKQYSKSRLRRLLNKLDDDMGRAMKSGEQSLRQPVKKYQFSPTLRKSGLLLQYWRLRFKDHFNESTSERSYQTIVDELQHYESDFQLPYYNTALSLDEIRKEFKAATKALKETQRLAGTHRYNFQNDLIEKYRDEGDTRRMRIVERCIQAEHSRALFRKIGSNMKPRQHSSLSTITVPHHPDPAWDALLTPHEVLQTVPEDIIEWEHVFDQATIEETLLEYNRQSFRQASESILGAGFLFDSLKFSSISKAGADLLSGQLPASWKIDDPRLIEFLASFAIPDNIKSSFPINTNITADDFIYGIRGWKEKTSTSPSGRHLGHYKAIIEDPKLLSFYVSFMNILISNGLSLERWQNAINVLIEKDPGAPKINRLRIIHLFEADYNFILKLLWGSRLVRKGEKHDCLNNNQHGSRHNRQGLDPVQLQLISMDLCRLLKLDIASFDNDASACYDRIIVALGMLAARRLGMPDHAIKCHSQALMMMKYAIKTIYGVSEHNYSGTPFEPLFGTGQGSGASPAVWLTLVVILLNTLDKLITSRMNFTSPDKKQLHSRLADAFVDDTSMGFTSAGELTYPAMIEELQHIAQTWEKLLHYSGGALNLKKCHWWLMYWEWKAGRPTLRPHRSDDPPIHLIPGRDTTAHQIKHSAVTQANRILGVYLAPDGNFHTQLEILRHKAQQYSALLSKSRLTPSEAYTFYRTTYIPAMTYTLPVVSCDEEEFQPVQSAVLPALLNQMGVHRKYPTALRHGPSEQAGLDIIDLQTESGIHLLKSLRDSVFSDKEHGRMMLTSIKTSQLESGISDALLSHPTITVSYLTPTWVTTIRQYLHNHGMTVSLTDTLDMSPSCHHDQLLMDPEKIKQYTTDEQLDINLARIHLQAIWLSDLTTGDGLRIRSSSLHGKIDDTRTSTYNWPRQPLLSTKQRNRWKRYLKEQFLLSDGHSLKRPLGSWIHLNRNQWRYTTLGNRLHDHVHQLSAPLQSTSRRSVQFGKWTPKDYTSNWAHHQPTTIIHQTTTTTSVSLRDWQAAPSPPLPPTAYSSFRSYIQSLPTKEQRLLQQYTQQADDITVWRALRSKQALTIASDGGLKTHYGTFGWKIVTSDDTVLFSGAGPVDGDISSESSTRSELYGIAAPILILASLHRFWGTKHRAKYKWICDSKAALKQVHQLQYHKTRKRQQPNNVDILSFIFDQLPAIGRKLDGQWVKAHQDDATDYTDLSRAARLNVDADRLATWYREQAYLPQSRQHTSHTPGTAVSIRIGAIRLVGNFDSSIRRHINGYYTRQYMKERQGWNDAVFHSIDWDNFGQHFKALPMTARIQRSKLIHRWQPVGTQRLRDAKIKDPNLALCPTCQICSETPDHLFLCDKRQGLRHRLYQHVTKITHRKPYHPALVILTNGIAQWLSMEPITVQEQVSTLSLQLRPIVSQALYEQFDIGWNNAVRGILSAQWAQAAAMDSTHGLYNIDAGNNHIYRTIRALHNFSTDIWASRNKQLHRRDDEVAARIRTPIDAIIIHLYNQPHLLHATDRFRCDNPLAKILNYRLDNKRRWVRRVERAQARYREIQQRQQASLITYPGYSYTARQRTIHQVSPQPIPVYIQTTLFGLQANPLSTLASNTHHHGSARSIRMKALGSERNPQRQTLLITTAPNKQS